MMDIESNKYCASKIHFKNIIAYFGPYSIKEYVNK